MNITKGKLSILALVGVLFLSGCTKGDDKIVDQDNPTTMPGVIEPGDQTPEDMPEVTIVDPTANPDPDGEDTTPSDTEFAVNIDGIESIVLKDTDGNLIDRTFTDEDIAKIETAVNESVIMDTSYDEMITGYNMTILLDNGNKAFITSYGDPVLVVATVGNEIYHLKSEAIATILLEDMN
jgi:hypothetical protein